VLIYVCLSSHGYGHASRSAVVLQELARRRPHWRLVLSTVVNPEYLELALGDVRHERRACRWDVGVVQADALGVDAPATLAALEALERELPAQLAAEARWLQHQAEPTLVLADVPPAAALLAARLALPLVWLASFGWDAIYAPMGEPFQTHAQACRQLYARGDLLLRCPLDLPMDWDVPAIQLGLTTSAPRLDTEMLRRQLRLPQDRQRCVLISFGGMGKAYDPALLRRWPDHVLIGPDPALACEPNGRVFPEGVRPLDLMPLCARMITKPGYSSFCEAFSQGVGIHLVRRSGFAEAPVLEAALRRHGQHRLLEAEAFERGAWELDQPLLPPSRLPLASDGADTAAAALVRMAEQRSAVPIDRQGGVGNPVVEWGGN